MIENVETSGGKLPIWAQLRISHGYAGQEEIAGYENVDVPDYQCMPGCKTTDQCSGCVSSQTGGCSPGTACLMACLQSKQ